MNLIQFLKDILLFHPDAPLLFNSFVFLGLFVVVLLIYSRIFHRRTLRTLFLLAFSLFFYYKTSGLFVLLLVATLLVVYLHTKCMSRLSGGWRRLLLVLNVLFVVGVLAYFKYANFLGENIFALLHKDFHRWDIFLPVGISFYSFQLLSYAIDVYRREIPEERNILDYAFYITFFPQLVAGPIVRAKNFLPQLKQDVHIRHRDVDLGFFLIMQGLFKKVIVADYLAQYNDLVFGNPGAYSGFETLLAIYGYAIQIYCDFSGYTDIAIGIGRMMGFDLGINFNKPYQSTSLSDFWHRWHISLSTWLRDYLYIPMGGNRKGFFRTCLNQLMTMLIGGLWHGANWKFVFWGGAHGLGLVFDKVWRRVTHRRFDDNRFFKVVGWFLTLHFVVFLWIFFRADSFQVAWQMVQQACTGYNLAALPAVLSTRALFVAILLLSIAIHCIPSSRFSQVERMYLRTPFLVKAVCFLLLIQCMLQLQSADVQPFIYFQF